MDVEVLIAGAGPTGLALGIQLARRGVAFRIVDAAAEPFGGSRGDGLQPRTLEVFDDLGVIDEVLAAGAPPAPLRATIGGQYAGERRIAEPAEQTPDVPYPNPWVVPQWRTERILRSRLTELGADVEWATGLVGFEQDRDGVTAKLSSGTVRAAHLVGADGGRSTVRKALGVGFPGHTDESLRMLIADVRADGLDPARGHWFATADEPARGIALAPLPGTGYFQVSVPAADGFEPTLPALQRLLDELSGGAGGQLLEMGWSAIWRPNARLAQRFRVGRVVLAGDAAHVHPPTGGQGLNTGVQDAYNLGWKLDGEPGLLDSYEAERRPVAAAVLGLSAQILRRHTKGDADAYRRGAETRQLGIGYRESPLSREERTEPGAVRAGDRAPDSPVLDADGHPARLFDLFRGTHWTLLAFGAEPPQADSSVRAHRVDHDRLPGSIVDVDGHARRAYDVTDGTLVLVRPDGYIGRIWQEPQDEFQMWRA
ncbi:FAD-dependent monooxygenase [Saccharopolyspora erythraea]|uniref:FAD-dependent monooxygenase n=1 Tax=Saccharopolyspora erythraea TaxID=1836 RepID=UPI001BA59192|nr:FAD-dependent monooxygenase [Saccharopolyspora erythraea]QUH04598.1 FAD-dependent monooxygenase [Saccharopolyspora erythraea]